MSDLSVNSALSARTYDCPSLQALSDRANARGYMTFLELLQVAQVGLPKVMPPGMRQVTEEEITAAGFDVEVFRHNAVDVNLLGFATSCGLIPLYVVPFDMGGSFDFKREKATPEAIERMHANNTAFFQMGYDRSQIRSMSDEEIFGAVNEHRARNGSIDPPVTRITPNAYANIPFNPVNTAGNAISNIAQHITAEEAVFRVQSNLNAFAEDE